MLRRLATLTAFSRVCFCSPVERRDISTSDVAAAYKQLQTWYDQSTGLWDGAGWWQSANVISTITNFAMIHDDVRDDVVSIQGTTFNRAQQASDEFLGQRFTNNYYDDEGWWSLAWIAAYDLTGNPEYLSMAESIFNDMRSTFGNTNCSRNGGGTGGIFWNREQTYVNAIANELLLSVAASLANRVQGKDYLDLAIQQWRWFQGSTMINSDGTINDGLTEDCQNNKMTVWSYNQGVILGALTEMSRATGDNSYLSMAQRIADAAISTLAPNGILQESCEADGIECDQDQVHFKGIFARNLQTLQRATGDDRYASFLRGNAESIQRHNVEQSQMGLRWTGPFVTPANASTHSSAMDCLVASLAM